MNFINCLYYQFNLKSVTILINDVNKLTKTIIQDVNLFNKDKKIIKFEKVISNDNNCFLDKIKHSNCFIMNSLDKEINLISCTSQNNCIDLKIYYFQKPDEFIFVCQKKNKFLLIIINKNICRIRTFLICNYTGFFTVFYNKKIQEYSIIGEFNFTGHQILRHLSFDNTEFVSGTINDIYSERAQINYDTSRIINKSDIL